MKNNDGELLENLPPIQPGHQYGERVIAILKATEDKVWSHGEGTYIGDLVPDHFLPIPNPCIKLDNGDLVWGFMCWWGPIEQMKKWFGDREVVLAKVHDAPGIKEQTNES